MQARPVDAAVCMAGGDEPATPAACERQDRTVVRMLIGIHRPVVLQLPLSHLRFWELQSQRGYKSHRPLEEAVARRQSPHRSICSPKVDGFCGGERPKKARDWAACRNLVADALLLAPLQAQAVHKYHAIALQCTVRMSNRAEQATCLAFRARRWRSSSPAPLPILWSQARMPGRARHRPAARRHLQAWS